MCPPDSCDRVIEAPCSYRTAVPLHSIQRKHTQQRNVSATPRGSCWFYSSHLKSLFVFLIYFFGFYFLFFSLFFPLLLHNAFFRIFQHILFIKLSFLSPPPYGEGLYIFVRVPYVWMYVSSLRRYWSKSNVQYMKSTWNHPLMTTDNEWQQILLVVVFFSYSKKIWLNNELQTTPMHGVLTYFLGYEPALLLSLYVFCLPAS